MSGTRRTRLLFGTVAVLLPLAVLELALRIVFPLPEVLNFDRVHYSPLALTPNVARATSLGRASFVVASDPDGLEFVHHLNLYGFRDRDWPRRKPPGATRVAFLGDSVVEGFMAADTDTIPAGFEQAARAGGESVDVLNLGVAAADFPEYLRLARDSVPLFRPDCVVLVVYANDFRPAPYDPAWLAEPLEPAQASPWQPRILYVARALSQRRRLPRRWTERPFPFFAAVPDPANPWSDPERARRYRAFVDPGVAEAMRRGRFNPFAVDSLPVYEMLLLTPEDRTPHLRALRDFTERHGARLYVVYFPTRNQVSDRYRGAQRRFSREARAATFTGMRYQRQARELRSACEQLAIPFLDLTPLLRERETEKGPLFRKYDEHMTGEGYRLVGSAIYGWWSSEQPAKGADEAARPALPWTAERAGPAIGLSTRERAADTKRKAGDAPCRNETTPARGRPGPAREPAGGCCWSGACSASWQAARWGGASGPPCRAQRWASCWRPGAGPRSGRTRSARRSAGSMHA